MQQLTANETNGLPMPPGVTPITDLKNQKRASKTLSKAVGLHLEGKLESAARLLTKALEDGEREPELDPKHRTAYFNIGVCHGNLKRWNEAAEAFRRAAAVDSSRSDVFLGLGIALIHDGRPHEALQPLDKYLSLFPEHEQALFGNAVALQQTGRH